MVGPRSRLKGGFYCFWTGLDEVEVSGSSLAALSGQPIIGEHSSCVLVRGGSEASVEFRLGAPESRHRVRGVVLDNVGKSVPGADVTLVGPREVNASLPILRSRQQLNPQMMEHSNFPACLSVSGDSRLKSTRRPASFGAQPRPHVSGDIEDLAIRLAPSFPLDVIVEWEGARAGRTRTISKRLGATYLPGRACLFTPGQCERV